MSTGIRQAAFSCAVFGVLSMLALSGGSRDVAAKSRHETRTVVIEGMKFNPDRVEARSGDTIVWKNQDIVPHTATAADKSFDSLAINMGTSWKTVVRKKGEIPYGCNFHPTMKGVVVVK